MGSPQHQSNPARWGTACPAGYRELWQPRRGPGIQEKWGTGKCPALYQVSPFLMGSCEKSGLSLHKAPAASRAFCPGHRRDSKPVCVSSPLMPCWCQHRGQSTAANGTTLSITQPNEPSPQPPGGCTLCPARCPAPAHSAPLRCLLPCPLPPAKAAV